MKVTNYSYAILLLLAPVLLFSCQKEDQLPATRNVQIVNDESLLSQRITLAQDTLAVEGNDSAGRKIQHFRLILKSSLKPPQIDGKTLQATALQDHWGGFLVSYNYKGEEYYGGVDYVDANLKVQSQILYRDADIHSVTAHDRYVFLTGAKQGEENPAYAERIMLDGNKFSMSNNIVKPLGSYAATSVLYQQGNIFVTTGNNALTGGGLYKLSYGLDVLDYKPLHDARWVDGHGNEIFVGQGTPGTISGFTSNSMKTGSTFSFDGANEAESKTTIDVDSKRIFVAAGMEGVKILDKNSGELLHTISFGEGHITNAVSAENGLLFISNGIHGAYVATYEEGNNKDAPVVVGRINLGEDQSVNHVLFRNYRLWIASGLTGVHMVEIEIW